MCREIASGGRRCPGPKQQPRATSTRDRSVRRCADTAVRLDERAESYPNAAQASYDLLAEDLVAALHALESRRGDAVLVAVRGHVARLIDALGALLRACRDAHSAREARMDAVFAGEKGGEKRARVEFTERALTRAEAGLAQELVVCRPRADWDDAPEIWRGLAEADLEPLVDETREAWEDLATLSARQRARQAPDARLDRDADRARRRAQLLDATLRRLRAELAAAPEDADEARVRIERARAAVERARAEYEQATADWLVTS